MTEKTPALVVDKASIAALIVIEEEIRLAETASDVPDAELSARLKTALDEVEREAEGLSHEDMIELIDEAAAGATGDLSPALAVVSKMLRARATN